MVAVLVSVTWPTPSNPAWMVRSRMLSQSSSCFRLRSSSRPSHCLPPERSRYPHGRVEFHGVDTGGVEPDCEVHLTLFSVGISTLAFVRSLSDSIATRLKRHRPRHQSARCFQTPDRLSGRDRCSVERRVYDRERWFRRKIAPPPPPPPPLLSSSVLISLLSFVTATAVVAAADRGIVSISAAFLSPRFGSRLRVGPTLSPVCGMRTGCR